MASARTAFARALRSTTINTPKPAARRPLSTFSHIRAQPVRPAVKPQSGRSPRNYSSDAAPKKGGKGGLVAGAAVVLGGATYYLYSTNQLTTYFPFLAGFADPEEARKLKTGKGWKPAFEDYQRVYNTIASMLEDDPDYDDGSYAPVLIRLAWHCSGTYDTKTKTGGSNGATMRFAPESGHGANAGLHVARDLMEKVKAEHPWITYSDLWTLAGVAGIQEIGGPAIPWRPGRTDADMSACTPDGRLPDASKGAKHIRDIFYRMGFDDREIVALLGAHAIGRCHDDRSGYSGPWTFSPTYFTNEFYKLLMNEKWTWKKWNGPPQYEDVTSKSLMMLPTDMELIKDKEFSKHTKRYADDEQVFFKEFSEAFAKLLELGVPFERDEKWIFKTLEQQEEEKSKKEKK